MNFTKAIVMMFLIIMMLIGKAADRYQSTLQ
jgi:hypothetical protein